jgi:predicted RecB family endonuclease
LEVWFKQTGYNVINRDVRRGLYKRRRVAVDFILEKDGKFYAVEVKC